MSAKSGLPAPDAPRPGDESAVAEGVASDRSPFSAPRGRLAYRISEAVRHGPILLEFSLFTVSVVVLQGSRFMFNIAVARSMTGSDFTYWALILAAITYSPALLIGSVNGMGRQLPYLVGAGRLAEARAAQAAVSWTLGLASLLLVLVAGAASVAGFRLAWPIAWILLGTLVFTVQQFVLRSNLAFNRASVQQLILGAALLAATGALLFFGWGDLVTSAIAYGSSLVVAIVVGAVLSRPILLPAQLRTWRVLVSIGFPIMLAGMVFSVFVTADRWIATSMLGAAAAAPYALASVVGSSMLIVPNVISQQTYPRMAILFGKSGDRHQVIDLARRQSLLAFAAAIPLALVADAAIVLLVPVLLPAYDQAILPACVIAIGFAVLASGTGFGNYLNVVGRQWVYLKVQLGSAAAGLLLMVVGALTLGAPGIAIGVSASYAIYAFWLRREARIVV